MYDHTSHEALATQSFLRALRLQHLERVGGLTLVPEFKHHNQLLDQTKKNLEESKLSDTKS